MRLRGHGGDVVVDNITDGVVSLDFQGACRGCPALTLTYVAVVEPAVLGVEGVKAVAPPRGNIAPAVLNRIRRVMVKDPRRAVGVSPDGGKR
jgi:hypothetical protein